MTLPMQLVQKAWLPGDKGGRGINWEIGNDICTLLYIKQIIGTCCIAQGTLLNTLLWPIWEKNLKKKGESGYMYMYN